MEHLNKKTFLEKVFNYEANKEWKFEGELPCIIDFYADWCRPCKMVAPIMEELAEKYKGQITIYKINTDQERELAQFFSIRSIPTMFFCPSSGDPQLTQAGARVGAFRIENAQSTDAMLLLTLTPGNYTAEVRGVSGGGAALVEVYEVP